MKTTRTKCEQCGEVGENERFLVMATVEEQFGCGKMTVPCQIIDLCGACKEKVKRAFTGKFALRAV